MESNKNISSIDSFEKKEDFNCQENKNEQFIKERNKIYSQNSRRRQKEYIGICIHFENDNLIENFTIKTQILFTDSNQN